MARSRASRPPSSAPIRCRTGSAALPSEQAVIDATRVVHPHAGAGRHRSRLRRRTLPLRRQSSRDQRDDRVFRASRWRACAPRVTFDELVAYRAQRGMRFRTRPPAVVEGPVGAGTLDLPQACARAKRLHRPAVQVHADRPAHAGEDAVSTSTTRTCPISRWRSPTRSPRRSGISTPTSCRSTRPTCRAVPDEWQWAAAAMNRVLDAVKTTPAVHLCFGNYGGQSIQKGTWAQADRLSQRAARRSYRDGDRAPAAGGACGVPRSAAGDRLRARRRRHQVDRDRNRRPDRARDRARREACSAPAASATSIPTAASGCSSAISPTARSARWCRGAISIKDAPPEPFRIRP